MRSYGSSRPRGALLAALAIGTGLAGGVGASWGFNQKLGAEAHAASRQEPETRGAVDAQRSSPLVVQAPPADTSALEQRLQDLERAQKAQRAPVAAQQLAPQPSPEEMRAQHEAEHATAVARAAEQARDASWAPAAARSLEKDIDGLAATMGFTVASVDCRTNACIATVSFRDYGAAAQSWRSIVTQDTELRCTTEVYLGDPGRADQAFETKVVYSDCTR